MLGIFLAFSLILSLILLFLLYRTYSRPKENTREQYAFRCLTTVATLATLCIASITSKTSLPDQLLSAVLKSRKSNSRHPASTNKPAYIACYSIYSNSGFHIKIAC